MSKYYYLIAGLPDISFDEDKIPFTAESFMEEISPALSSADRKLTDMVFQTVDRQNLMLILDSVRKDGVPKDDFSVPEGFVRGGLFEASDLIRTVQAVAAEEKCPSPIPQYMYDFTAEYLAPDFPAVFPQDRLEAMFYDYACAVSNSFVSDWFSFNRDICNIQTAFTCRKYSIDLSEMIVGDGAVSEALRTSGARDWGLSSQLDFMEDLQRILEEPDLSVREHSMDMLRWNWLEEHSFFNYFTIEKLFAYLVKIQMAERWINLDREKGRRLFRSIIDELKGQTDIPEM